MAITDFLYENEWEYIRPRADAARYFRDLKSLISLLKRERISPSDFRNEIKNEIAQRRIPTQSGGGTSMMDSTYNPLSTNEDYFFPQTADGRGSSVEVLQGGQNLGEITDLRFFTNKLFRGLRIPSSYLPTGLDDGTQSYTDGKVGTALIQEWRFNQYCTRLQRMIANTLDKEFKMFLTYRGVNIDPQLFKMTFTPPQNFAQYRQADVDSARIGTFTQLADYPYLSKRFIMSRYLGLTEAEMAENEAMWAEENGEQKESEAGQADLRNAGISPGGIDTDLGSTEMPDAEGADGADPAAGGLPGADAGAAPPAPAPVA